MRRRHYQDRVGARSGGACGQLVDLVREESGSWRRESRWSRGRVDEGGRGGGPEEEGSRDEEEWRPCPKWSRRRIVEWRRGAALHRRRVHAGSAAAGRRRHCPLGLGEDADAS
jgi:hypothetical protein